MTRAEGFEEFFMLATGGHRPFDWQRRMATGEHLPEVVRVPTGAGKTEGAVLSWLWRRRDPGSHAGTPRRLVYCLPMRVLVEQTHERCREMVGRLGLADAVAAHVLMGGAVSQDWTERPEDDAILVGTLDQLVSRALLRGYGVSRFQWPIHFALLNNDALWILDEVQLFGEALATTSQLHGLRRALPSGCGPTHTVAMSATVDPAWIATVDRPTPVDALGLSQADRDGALKARLRAPKILTQMESIDRERVLGAHRPGTLTLVIVNTVAAARDLYRSLERGLPDEDPPELVLVHSRFRPRDRSVAVDRMRAEVPTTGPGRIVVSTQVVEAGVDLSAATLITAAAPWASLVQRFGRCNRRGELRDARVLWAVSASAVPYDEEHVARAVTFLAELEGCSVDPESLDGLTAPLDPPPRRHVLRRRDLLGLFDTAPELSGLDLDIGRFVRDVDDLTVSLAWRNLADGRPSDDEPDLRRDELCPIGIGEARALIKEAGGATPTAIWRHDPLDGTWRRIGPGELRPGDRLLTDVGLGRYHPARGFDPTTKEPVPPEAPAEEEPESIGSDGRSQEGVWLSLSEHTDGVCRELDDLIGAFSDLQMPEIDALRSAARLHDWGKAHPVFQTAMWAGAQDVPERLREGPLAKRRGRAPRYERRGFRHELASLLGYLATPGVDGLTAYLIASHHGRIRLGARTVPGETVPDAGRTFTLGCWQGDALPPVDLGGGTTTQEAVLDLRPLELGSDDGPTYTDLALDALARLGPFRLAFLETVLRTADTRCSRREAEGA